jgi:hypothetical protein
MIPSAEARASYVKKIMAESAPIRTRRVYYKGKTSDLKVYRFDLNNLIFNQYNDRIAVEMKTRYAKLGEVANIYTEELEDTICKILWEESLNRNISTLKNIENIGQQEPGVITLDGVIIDGNRRAMLLKKHLNNNWFEAGVIEEVLADNKKYIRELETQIQFGTDDKVDYEPINKYLKVKDFYDIDRLSIEQIADLFNEEKSKIKEYLDVMRLMDDYLKYIDAEGIYTLLKFISPGKSGTKEGPLIDLRNNLSQLRNSGGKAKVAWAYTESDVDDYQRLYFDYIRSECTDPKNLRLLAPAKTNSKGGVFMSEEIFKDLVSKHNNAIWNETSELEDFQDYSKRPECANLSYEDISKKRELEWQSKIKKDEMQGRLFKADSNWTDIKEGAKPIVLLSDALKKLEMITDAHLESDEFLVDPEAQENARRINSKIYKIKKAMGL